MYPFFSLVYSQIYFYRCGIVVSLVPLVSVLFILVSTVEGAAVVVSVPVSVVVVVGSGVLQ
jgi:hypothetical protein